MRFWADLHHDLVVLIANHVDSIEDYLAFSRVCPSWRLVASKQNFIPSSPQIPCILLLGNDRERKGYHGGPQEIYSLSLRETIGKVLLPEAWSVYFVECSVPVAESSSGWILRCYIPRHDRLCVTMTLWNPFSGAQFPLPSFRNSYLTDIHKVALLKNACNVSDFEITFIVNGFLAYWKVGNRDWTVLNHNHYLRYNFYEEIKYHNGRLYAITFQARVEVFSSDSQTLGSPVLVASLPSSWDLDCGYVDDFLVEKSTEKLFVAWKNKHYDPVFHVYEVDVVNGGCKEVRDLEDKSIFLGKSYTSLVKVSRRIESNKIYYSHVHKHADSTTVYAYSLENRHCVMYFGCSHYQPIFLNPTL